MFFDPGVTQNEGWATERENVEPYIVSMITGNNKGEGWFYEICWTAFGHLMQLRRCENKRVPMEFEEG